MNSRQDIDETTFTTVLLLTQRPESSEMEIALEIEEHNISDRHAIADIEAAEPDTAEPDTTEEDKISWQFIIIGAAAVLLSIICTIAIIAYGDKEQNERIAQIMANNIELDSA